MVDSALKETDGVVRRSALAGHYNTGRSGFGGPDQEPGVILKDMQGLVLYQVAAWPESIGRAVAAAVKATGAKNAPGPGAALTGTKGSLLRIEPLKWWVYGAEVATLPAEQGTTLDLSHSRTHVRVSGDDSVSLLNRHLSLDLREKSFPVDSVASTAFHHCGVTLWRSGNGYELFLPRGFALALWEMLVESAEQFGVEVI